LLGYAVGVVGLTPDAFLDLTPRQFQLICEQRKRKVEADYQEKMERTRWLAYQITRLTTTRFKINKLKDLAIFPWEKGFKKRKKFTQKELKQRSEELLKRYT